MTSALRPALLLASVLLASGCLDGALDETASSALDPGPLFVTGAFDGSQRFGMWAATMDFARRLERETGKRLRFTYFINTAYYDRGVRGSWIGTAESADEEIVRWALTQQALNEGHEIGDHSVRHQDGSSWTVAAWRAELDEFHDLVAEHLFEPVTDGAGAPVFPRWRPVRAAAPGEVGAACGSDQECSSGRCLPVAPEQAYCTQTCNRSHPCPAGTVCGTPTWTTDGDACVPMPEYPIEWQGQELFDASGQPNLEHPALQRAHIEGFRAPQLGHNSALYDVLTELGYTYDTSKILAPGAPRPTTNQGRAFGLWQFPLMKYAGSLTVPMDYNYKVSNGTYERMRADYRSSILQAYGRRDRAAWNIGHHFALWNGGAYWRAMQDALRFAADGCPDDGGAQRCPDVEFPTFRELAATLATRPAPAVAGAVDLSGPVEQEPELGDGTCGCVEDAAQHASARMD